MWCVICTLPLASCPMRLGILGGTFDPPHFGHLKMAEAALTQLQLDKVLFAPAGLQPLKLDQQSTTPDIRAHMVELAIADRSGFELCRIDLDRPGPHYSIDLLSLAHDQYPQSKFWFIMGEDSLADLLRWRKPDRLIQLTRLAVLRRPNAKIDWNTLEKELPDLQSKIDWLNHTQIHISAREIRQRVKDGMSIEELVPKNVAEYIQQNILYLS